MILYLIIQIDIINHIHKSHIEVLKKNQMKVIIKNIERGKLINHLYIMIIYQK